MSQFVKKASSKIDKVKYRFHNFMALFVPPMEVKLEHTVRP